jgi:hypothetical protein
MTAPDRPEFPTPVCPLCSSPPAMVIGPTQAVCGNADDCPILIWNPSATLEENLTNAGFADFKERGEEPGTS